MGNWSLAVQGFTGDVKKVEGLIERVRAILADVDLGTGYAAFSHDGVTTANLHVSAEPAPATIPGGSDAPSAETGSDSAPDPSQGG
jgi:hypothetical protein